MKKILFISIYCILLFGCGNAPKKVETVVSSADTIVEHTIQAEEELSERQRLLQLIRELGASFEHGDVDAIASYFEFPIDGSSVAIYGIDPLFDDEYQNNRRIITREMFNEHFEFLYEHLRMGGFKELFQYLPIDTLLDEDEVSCEKHIENSGCYYIYEIRINGDEITIMFASNSEPDYLEKHPDYEYEEWCSESAYFWTFTFDGQKLWFTKQDMAG